MTGLDTDFMLEILPKLLRATWITIQISLLTVLLSCIFGGFLSAFRILGGRVTRWVIIGFVEFTRGVPPLVQIAFIYFALPRLDVVFNEFWTGVTALTFIGAGYTIEIVRAAVESLGRGQREASLALGLGPWQTLFLVLFPQALRRILPPLTNELVNVVKASALLSVISVNELTKVANELIYIHFVVIEVLIELTVLYLVVVGSLMWLSRWLERRSAS